MTAQLTASELRQWATRCFVIATQTIDSAERERLLRMRDAFLELAGNEDWLPAKRRPIQESDADIQAFAERMVGNGRNKS